MLTILLCTEDTIPMSSWSQFWCPQMSAASVLETDKKSAETSSTIDADCFLVKKKKKGKLKNNFRLREK